ncbi:MAG: DUF1295 domain-containing protein [Myxococcales bacterium]|nr:DUF1295 domain-containing protein [Myxococcota bacterium]MDW8282833.1 DUF1295 domain-containing protein [Myxococcales bacterium]
MDERQLYAYLLTCWFLLAPVAAAVLLRVNAPYGRHARPGFGPALPARLGWLVMEMPAAVGMPVLFLLGDRRGAGAVALLLLWQVHYVHRALIFPFRMRGGRPMPLAVVLAALVFNVCNVYLNGRWLFALGPPREAAWLLDPRFAVGAGLFLGGLAINLHADTVLLRLRREGETGYRVPQGGLFRFVSCPNYLGEIIEWLGWALASSSLAGLAFALWTAANLVPRARAHHRFYRERLPDYPAHRRALVPFLY